MATISCLFYLFYFLFCLSDCLNIVLFHARKAGGTTTLRWLKEFDKLVLNNTLNIIHIEAYPPVHAGRPHNKKRNVIQAVMEKYQNDALFIMVLRHPIDRILSQYDFEWRWGCLQCDARDDLPQFNLTLANFMKSMRFNRQDASQFKYCNVDFHDFIERVQRFEMRDAAGAEYYAKHAKELSELRWLPYAPYLSNYYLWFMCCDSAYCSIGNRESGRCFEKAKQIIDSMDVLLITEWMSDARMQFHFNKIIIEYATKASYRGFELVNVPSGATHWRRVDSYNVMIAREDYQRLLKWNAMDLKLFEYARRVAFANVKAGQRQKK